MGGTSVKGLKRDGRVGSLVNALTGVAVAESSPEGFKTTRTW